MAGIGLKDMGVSFLVARAIKLLKTALHWDTSHDRSAPRRALKVNNLSPRELRLDSTGASSLLSLFPLPTPISGLQI